MLREQNEEASFNITTSTLDYLILLERKLNLPSSTNKYYTLWKGRVGSGANSAGPNREISQGNCNALLLVT